MLTHKKRGSLSASWQRACGTVGGMCTPTIFIQANALYEMSSSYLCNMLPSALSRCTQDLAARRIGAPIPDFCALCSFALLPCFDGLTRCR